MSECVFEFRRITEKRTKSSRRRRRRKHYEEISKSLALEIVFDENWEYLKHRSAILSWFLAIVWLTRSTKRLKINNRENKEGANENVKKREFLKRPELANKKRK